MRLWNHQILPGHQGTKSLVDCSSVLIHAVCQRKGQYKASSVMEVRSKVFVNASNMQ
jgi:hypothetical protein